MKLDELKETLGKQPDANIRFLLPNGDFVPVHAHVTEAARIDKRFVDCGGTLRNEKPATATQAVNFNPLTANFSEGQTTSACCGGTKQCN